MKASEVIKRLQELIEEHGDLTVVCEDGLDPSDRGEIESIQIYGKSEYTHYYDKDNNWMYDAAFLIFLR